MAVGSIRCEPAAGGRTRPARSRHRFTTSSYSATSEALSANASTKPSGPAQLQHRLRGHPSASEAWASHGRQYGRGINAAMQKLTICAPQTDRAERESAAPSLRSGADRLLAAKPGRDASAQALVLLSVTWLDATQARRA